jgi:hypothetical protein
MVRTTAKSSTETRLIVIVSPSPFYFFWARTQASGALFTNLTIT